MINVSRLQDEELRLLAESKDLFNVLEHILKIEKEKVYELQRKEVPSGNVFDITFQLNQGRRRGIVDCIEDITKLREYSQKELEKRKKVL